MLKEFVEIIPVDTSDQPVSLDTSSYWRALLLCAWSARGLEMPQIASRHRLAKPPPQNATRPTMLSAYVTMVPGRICAATSTLQQQRGCMFIWNSIEHIDCGINASEDF